MRICSTFLFLLLIIFAGFGCSQKLEYPDRPIQLISPWSAGGGTDRVARQIASQLEREMDIPVNVINATGGGGVIGHTRGALSRPDGYNMTLITAEINMLHWRGLTNITYKDYNFLMKVNQDNAAIFIRSNAPWEKLIDLEQAVRENSGRIQASGTAFGGIWHVSMAGWLLEAGLPANAITWISINGSAPSLQELMAGGVDVVVCSFAEAKSLYDAGVIRSLGVMSEERLAEHPDIPTFKEQGYDWTSQTWRALAVPNGVPKKKYAILLQEVQNVIHSVEYQQFLDNSGFGKAEESPEEFFRFLEEENQSYGKIFNDEAFESVVSQRYGPMLFPYIILALMGIVIIVLFLNGHLQLDQSVKKITIIDYGRVFLVAGSVVIYLLLAEFLGFIITASLILSFLLVLFKVKWSKIILIVLILVPFTYQLFAVYLRVPLPWGFIGW